MRNIQLPASNHEWTEDDARIVLEEWRRSGTTLAAFARQRGVSAPRLYWWRRRLSSSETRTSSVSLVPATIVSTTAPAIVIQLANGIAVEVAGAGAGVSPAWIAEVVVALARSRE